MSLKDNFAKVAIEQAPKQAVMVDNLLEEAPILGGVPMEGSSHDVFNVFEELANVNGAEVGDMDGATPAVSADSKLVQKDLSVIRGKITVPLEKARRYGGKEKYFAKQMPSILTETGANMEKSLIYDNMRKTAIDASNTLTAGGTGTALNSIVCVKWRAGLNTGLYSKEMFGNGKVFDFIPLSGGNPYTSTVNGKEMEIFGMSMLNYIGFQFADLRGVSGIVNIESTAAGSTNKPTSVMMDDMVTKARGAIGNTVIYCHQSTYDHFIKPLLAENGLQTQNGDQNVYRSFGYWNGIPIVPSYNFLLNGEAAV